MIIVFVGWDGTGYKRLFYVAAEPAWSPEAAVSVVDFFKSNIFITLIWLEALILIPYNVLFIRWRLAGLRIKDQ